MEKDPHLLFSGFSGRVSEGVRFLLPSDSKGNELHRALFTCLNEPARTALHDAFAEDVNLFETVLQEMFHVIDPDGCQAYYGSADVLPVLSPEKERVVAMLAHEADLLQKRFPRFIGNRHPAYRTDDNEFVPSIETIVSSVLSLMGDDTGRYLYGCAEGLLSRAYSLLAREKGYDDLADAERDLDAAAYDAEFTDGLCSGEG